VTRTERSANPIFARAWSRLLVKGLARNGGDDLRRRLLAGLSGTVVEVGAGDGANFAFYPGAVDQVVAVEPDPYLRERAERRAADAPVSVEVVDGSAERLPIDEGRVDAVVFCLVLCSVPDQAMALAEARRVLGPAGAVHFLEHVRAHEPGPMRRVQDALDATVWPHLFGGCHVGRDTVTAMGAAGFAIDEEERFWFPARPRLPMSAAVLGHATAV
jgi:ubiquinone/menaquinone biosynthesis C-methylase UbiE